MVRRVNEAITTMTPLRTLAPGEIYDVLLRGGSADGARLREVALDWGVKTRVGVPVGRGTDWYVWVGGRKDSAGRVLWVYEYDFSD